MIKECNNDYVTFNGNELIFNGCFKPSVFHHAQIFLNNESNFREKTIILDFKLTIKAHPNAMVPLIAKIQLLRTKGVKTVCILPEDEYLRSLFIRTNWAYFIEPERYDLSTEGFDRHLAVQSFRTVKEQQKVVNDTMDVIMRTLELDRNFIKGIEWVLSEITDNVLNHANSPVGGFLQLTTYSDSQRVVICVADAGRGILSSLRESRPGLRYDSEAIAEAVRAGVTRNKDVGQGNGLSGTLAIATETNGFFAICSGIGSVNWNNGMLVNKYQDKHAKRFSGTIVDLQIPLDRKIDIKKVLSLGDSNYAGPIDIIEMKYLSDNCDSTKITMRDETDGFGSRKAGEQIRIKAKNIMLAESSVPLIIDWDGIQMISSSYADEFIGKLFNEMGPINFMCRVHNTNMVLIVAELIDKAIKQRIQQEMNSK